ncbi:hypothetical protein [Algicola sagamiensis]|uniref:hypothetical protein n=1 Tax=Algicola sagamiensis TaxID=163869 RepID=UPI00036939CA|nr:hypothetical protein [Algicola sagamiensis]
MTGADLKILFITDSLGLPRLDPEPILAEETWIVQVEQQIRNMFDTHIQFYFYCVSGLQSDTVAIASQGILKAYQPDLVVVQQGIVDCYPRALKKNEVSILSRLPLLGKLSKWFVKKWYKEIVQSRDITYVSLPLFEQSWYKVKSQLDVPFIVVPIAPACPAYVQKNPRIAENIQQYNQVLAQIFGDGFLSHAFDSVDADQLFLSDNHHLSKFGNQVLSQAMEKAIVGRIKEKGIG